GMYLLDQIDKNLFMKMKKMGLEVSLDEIYNPERTGLANAVINMGATASFVSPNGLIITNHHVAFGAVQRISTPEKNYIEEGFLARTMEEEVPAPGYQAYVFLSMKDVTDEVLSAVKKGMSDFERYQAIERKIKEIIKREEKGGDVECRIASMNYGKQYYLFKYLKIKDVRIVYVPSRSIGEYGGDIDNWMWPRHTGDFAFLRAYIGPDGKPAEYSKKNVPYHPKVYFKISRKGIKEGDFTMIMGFPGRTYRRLTSFALKYDQDFRYPFQIKTASDMIRILEDFSKKDKTAAVKLSFLIKALNNVLKNNQGMLEGLIKTKLVEKKKEEEKAFLEFLKSNPEFENKYGPVFSELKEIYKKYENIRKKSTFIRWMTFGSQMLSFALRINKWSIEKQKKDIDREPGYQERDYERIKLRMKVAQRSLVPEADKKMLEYFLKRALELPSEQKIEALEKILEKRGKKSKEEALAEFLDELYSKTKLMSVEERLKMLELSRDELLKLKDPFIEFANELEKEREFLNRKDKEFSGALSRLMPVYIEGLETWKKIPLYPDANGTLRLNFGQVKGYSPRDAVKYHYITSLTGVVEKHTGKEPFDCPKKLLEAYKNKDFGVYIDKYINDIPVNFLTTNDSTGGNSGSPVLNGKGELIGLLFDGNYEAMYSDYYFDPKLTRSINVDIRYVLFIAEKIDKAFNVLRELTIVE
ncbi:S46 family peptidase, partial [SCandidatus Aminicenantes bacterium Aminicenantia_JdfR_composite]|nr:S46 family peptidase [SCandidatus Aminicenantes bacterium Aminicenantia_JdfR_composite]